ncbi:MAG TPA: pentapeptide repeat-containing protein, partial [Alphaproteobacteria bacterium]|nr:pentapeptide repeat-containing protein [Alphaproteobacteria bacterium]
MNPPDLIETVRRHMAYLNGRPGGARADLRGASLAHLPLRKLRLRTAVLAGADFTGASLAESDLSQADLFATIFDAA